MAVQWDPPRLPATHSEARLWCVRWSLFSITLLTLVAWARHARAVMVNMRRFGIADLRLRPQLKTVTLPQPSNQTDTATQRHSISRGVWTDVSRGNSWPLTLGSYRGVCTSTCVHVRCVFIMFSVCIWAKKHSWDRWGCFLFPLRLLVSPQFCSQSEVRCLSAPHLSQVNSPLTASCGIGSTLTSLHHYSSSLPLSFPRSRLTSPGAQCWDFLTFNTSVCLRSSCTPEKVHKLADMPRRR